jgi:hypothetical protein
VKTYPTLVKIGGGHRIVEMTADQRRQTEYAIDTDVWLRARVDPHAEAFRNMLSKWPTNKWFTLKP